MPNPELVVVLKGYPRLSETFIAQELLNLERSGFNLTLFSLRHPTDKKTHPVNDEITASIVYLPEYLYLEPRRVIQSWLKVRKQKGMRQVWSTFRRDFLRDRTVNRIRRLGQAMVLAAELPADTPAIYAHFLHTPASVARYAAMIRKLPWACSAHAKDIYTSPDWEIQEKLADLEWLTTCTRKNVSHLRTLTSIPEKISLNYHGLDLDRFQNTSPQFNQNNGQNESDPVKILSVGRAVEKKGYGDLLTALSNLPEQLHWEFHHIGGGPLLDTLKAQSITLGIDTALHWHGAQSQQFVLEQYRQSDLFVLNSCIDRHGDRDGLPNVMVEAQSQGLPVIGTTISGIPELVETEVNGLLVPSGNIPELAKALERMICDPAFRKSLGIAGRTKVIDQFEMRKTFSDLRSKLEELVETSP
ncbi:MAG: glycosyltransferase [Acidiferrobacterales bacterium]|nr:glycosyltransferase [Acidiferrobacterales bacterium]